MDGDEIVVNIIGILLIAIVMFATGFCVGNSDDQWIEFCESKGIEQPMYEYEKYHALKGVEHYLNNKETKGDQ